MLKIKVGNNYTDSKGRKVKVIFKNNRCIVYDVELTGNTEVENILYVLNEWKVWFPSIPEIEGKTIPVRPDTSNSFMMVDKKLWGKVVESLLGSIEIRTKLKYELCKGE